VELLVKNLGCDINAVSEIKGLSALHYACLHGHESILECLLNVLRNSKSSSSSSSHVKPAINLNCRSSNQGQTPLMLAAAYGRVGCVKLLIDSGGALASSDINSGNNINSSTVTSLNTIADVSLRNFDCKTAYQQAEGNMNLSQQSQQSENSQQSQIDANIVSKNKNIKTCLQLLASREIANKAEKEEKAKRHDAANDIIEDQSGLPTLYCCAWTGNADAVKKILDDLKMKSTTKSMNQSLTLSSLDVVNGHAGPRENYRTALHAAVRQGHLEVVKTFLMFTYSELVDVNVLDGDGLTPFQYVHSGQFAMS